jgi:hypothetical protein
VSVVHLLFGVVLVALGLILAVGRRLVAARYEERLSDRPMQSPMALGALLVLVGITQIALALK